MQVKCAKELIRTRNVHNVHHAEKCSSFLFFSKVLFYNKHIIMISKYFYYFQTYKLSCKTLKTQSYHYLILYNTSLGTDLCLELTFSYKIQLTQQRIRKPSQAHSRGSPEFWFKWIKQLRLR